MIKITDGKGFGIKFSNGYTVSVQFGYGNYSDNYDCNTHDGLREFDFRERNRLAGERGSKTAECAVINPKGDLIDLPEEFGGYSVSNRTKPDDILKLMNWASSLGESA